MTMTGLMTELATNPARLAEFRADPHRVLAQSQIEETAATTLASRDIEAIRQAIAVECGTPDIRPPYTVLCISQ